MGRKSSGMDDDYKLAMGSLILEVSALDSAITDLIAALIGIDAIYALILSYHQQFSNKVDILRAIFRILYPDETDPKFRPIANILDQTKAIGDFRNSIVHALWHVDEQGIPHVVRFQARGKLTRSRRPVPIEKIHQFSCEATELAEKLSAFAKEYRGYTKAPLQS